MVKKLLICDDDADIVDMLEMVLDEPGFQLITETDSRKVLELVLNEKPDLLLMDLWMPVMSGDQVLQQIRSNELLKALPVMIMSASRDGQSIAMDAGASGYIAKPFDIDELVTRVHQLAE